MKRAVTVWTDFTLIGYWVCPFASNFKYHYIVVRLLNISDAVGNLELPPVNQSVYLYQAKPTAVWRGRKMKRVLLVHTSALLPAIQVKRRRSSGAVVFVDRVVTVESLDIHIRCQSTASSAAAASVCLGTSWPVHVAPPTDGPAAFQGRRRPGRPSGPQAVGRRQPGQAGWDQRASAGWPWRHRCQTTSTSNQCRCVAV